MPWLIPVLGYFLGSIPTAYIAGRVLKGKDIRQIGDGNMGAQNAFWQLGAKIGFLVGTVDIANGALAVIIAQAANLPQVAVLVTGAAAVIGHSWPVFLKFRGGRGESTAIGVLLVLITQPLLVMAVPTIIALLILHSVTKASAILFIPLPLVCWWLGVSGIVIVYSIMLPCLIGFTHFLRAKHVPARQSS